MCRLKLELRCFVRTTKPRDLEEAILVAKLLEKGLTHSDKSEAPRTVGKLFYIKPLGNTKLQTVQKTLPTNSNAKSLGITKFKNHWKQHKRCFSCFEPW